MGENVKVTAEDLARDLAADLRLCQAATAGPWTVIPEGGPNPNNTPLGVGIPGPDGTGYPAVWVVRAWGARRADLAMIAAAGAGWPVALRRALAAEVEVATLRAVLSRCAAAAGCSDPADGCRAVLAVVREALREPADDR